MLVESGTPGNYHVYLRLAKSVKPEILRLLNLGLCLLVGGDQSKWPDNSLLRLPGTFNPKRELGKPRPVRVVQGAIGSMSARDMLDLIEAHTDDHVDLKHLKWASRDREIGKNDLEDLTINRESLLARVAPRVASPIRRNQLATGGPSTSEQLFNVLRDLYKHSDLGRDEAYTLMLTYEPMVDRYPSEQSVMQQVHNAWDEGEADPERTAERSRHTSPAPASSDNTPDRQRTWTDESNAQFLIQNHSDDFLALTSSTGDPLYHWDGSIWTEDGALPRLHKICAAYQDTLDDTNDSGEFSAALHRQGRSAATRNNMIRLFKIHIGRNAEELDADPTLLHIGSAVYDAKTGVIREPRRDDLMTKRTRATYDPRATCPEFERHVRRCLPDERTREYTRFLLSRVLTGRAGKHIPVLVGQPDSGKSAVVSAIAHPLGHYAKRVADDVALLKPGNSHKANLHALRDARLGMVHEPSDGTKFNIDQLKSLSGGDEQTSNAMRSDYETWTPRLQLLVTCNKGRHLRLDPMPHSPEFWTGKLSLSRSGDARSPGKRITRKSCWPSHRATVRNVCLFGRRLTSAK